MWGRKTLKKDKKDEWVYVYVCMYVCICVWVCEKVLAFFFSVDGDETLTKEKDPKSPYKSVGLVDNEVMKMEIFGGLQKGISGI